MYLISWILNVYYMHLKLEKAQVWKEITNQAAVNHLLQQNSAGVEILWVSQVWKTRAKHTS